MAQRQSIDRLFLFDIDGTLLDSQSVGRLASHDAMLEVFGTASTINTHRFAGQTDWRSLTDLLAPYGYDADAIQVRMPAYQQAAARHMERVVAEHHLTPHRGALESVQALRQTPGVLLGIVTGNVSTIAPHKLSAAGFDPGWFPVGAYGNESLDRDDLPRLALRRAIDYSGAPIEPERVVVIGDTPADIACARAVGAVAVAVCTGYSPREELARCQPDHLLDDLTTLLDVTL